MGFLAALPGKVSVVKTSVSKRLLETSLMVAIEIALLVCD